MPESASLTADLRTLFDRDPGIGAHGIDTIAYRFRPAPGFVDRLLEQPHRPSAAGVILDAAPGGIRVAVVRGVVRVEGRLDPLLTGDPEAWGLRPPSAVVPGAHAARETVERLARRSMGRGLERAEVARLDLACEFRFREPRDGLAFLGVMAALLPPGRKTDVVRSSDGSVQTVYYRTQTAFEVRERCYDKGLQSGSHPPGLRVRFEAQRRFGGSRALRPEAVEACDLPRMYGSRVAAYASTETLAIGRAQAEAALIQRVQRGELTIAKAERLLGTIAVLSSYGRAVYNDRQGRRRLAELRAHGVTPEAVVGVDRTLPVGELLRRSIEAWSQSRASATPSRSTGG